MRSDLPPRNDVAGSPAGRDPGSLGPCVPEAQNVGADIVYLRLGQIEVGHVAVGCAQEGADGQSRRRTPLGDAREAWDGIAASAACSGIDLVTIAAPSRREAPTRVRISHVLCSDLAR